MTKNMKIAVVGDIHLQARGGSEYLLEFQNSWLTYFLESCQAKGITDVIQAGDFFDNRTFLKLNILHYLQNDFKELIQKYNITWHVIAGNHDSYLRHDNSICTSMILESLDLRTSSGSKAFNVYYRSEDIDIHGTKILMLPWLDDHEMQKLSETIENSKAQICIGHLEIQNAQMYQGVPNPKGLNPGIFEKFYAVFSGHYHTINKVQNIQYIGSPYHLTWADVPDGDNRGFFVLDLGTLEYELIDNSNIENSVRTSSIFSEFEYCEDTNYTPEDLNHLSGKIIRLIVNKRDNISKYEYFMDLLKSMELISIRIDDRTIRDSGPALSESSETLESKGNNLLHYMNEYVKNNFKHLNSSTLKDIYTEALELN